jgi:hypothetical protein
MILRSTLDPYILEYNKQRSNIPTVVRESLCAGDTPEIMRDHVSSPPTTDVTWSAVTDQVMGGCSVASLTNDDDFYGRTAHVLRAHVSTANKGGFAQLATNLCAFNNNGSPMDASSFDGVEMDVLCEAQDGVKESFNVQYVVRATSTTVTACELVCCIAGVSVSCIAFFYLQLENFLVRHALFGLSSIVRGVAWQMEDDSNSIS